MTNSGKVFEGIIRESLKEAVKLHRGAYFERTEDGGAYAFNRQLSDFKYWTSGGVTVAIECKAVKGTALPLSRLGYDKQDGQLSRLVGFYGANRKSVLCVNYYESTVSKGHVYIVPIRFLLGLERASLTEKEASCLGIRCKKQGRTFNLDCLEGMCTSASTSRSTFPSNTSAT